MQFRVIPLACLTLAALAACSDNSNNTTSPGQGTANVRVVNASSASSSINASVGSQSLANGLSFQNGNAATSCVTVPAGSQTINFTSGTGGTSSLATANYNFVAGHNYTVVLYGNGTATPNAVVYPDSFSTAATGYNNVRFINATNSAGDVYFTAPGASLTGATPAVANLGAGRATGVSGGSAYTAYPSTYTSAQMFNVGATTNAVGTYNMATQPTTGGSTIIFTPAATAGGATAFRVGTCS